MKKAFEGPRGASGPRGLKRLLLVVFLGTPAAARAPPTLADAPPTVDKGEGRSLTEGNKVFAEALDGASG